MNRPRGGYGCSRKQVLEWLKSGPLHTVEIADKLGRSVSATRKCLNTAHKRGLIHVQGETNSLGVPIRYWHLGPGPAADILLAAHWDNPVHQTLLRLHRATINEIADQLQWGYHRVRANLYRLHNRGMARIVYWEQEGPLTALWAAERGPHEPKPKRLTSDKRSKRYYWRNRAECLARSAKYRGAKPPSAMRWTAKELRA